MPFMEQAADEHKGVARKKGTLIIGIASWRVGFLTILSFDEWSDFYPLDFIPAFIIVIYLLRHYPYPGSVYFYEKVCYSTRLGNYRVIIS